MSRAPDERPPQEPWDYDRFIELYNQIAKRRGGWRYEEKGRTPEEMRERYLRYPEDCADLETFADGLFTWDQGLDL